MANLAVILVDARKGVTDFRLTALGRSAHPGVAHQTGINAITALSKAIVQVDALTDYSKDLCATVARVAGGTSNNRIPDRAETWGELRSFSPEQIDYGIAALSRIVTESPDQLELEVHEIYPPWPANEKSQQLLQIWQQAASVAGEYDGFFSHLGQIATDRRNFTLISWKPAKSTVCRNRIRN